MASWERPAPVSAWHLLFKRTDLAADRDPWREYACGEPRPYPHGTHGSGDPPPAGEVACPECMAVRNEGRPDEAAP